MAKIVKIVKVTNHNLRRLVVHTVVHNAHEIIRARVGTIFWFPVPGGEVSVRREPHRVYAFFYKAGFPINPDTRYYVSLRRLKQLAGPPK